MIPQLTSSKITIALSILSGYVALTQLLSWVILTASDSMARCSLLLKDNICLANTFNEELFAFVKVMQMVAIGAGIGLALVAPIGKKTETPTNMKAVIAWGFAFAVSLSTLAILIYAYVNTEWETVDHFRSWLLISLTLSGTACLICTFFALREQKMEQKQALARRQ